MIPKNLKHSFSIIAAAFADIINILIAFFISRKCFNDLPGFVFALIFAHQGSKPLVFKKRDQEYVIETIDE